MNAPIRPVQPGPEQLRLLLSAVVPDLQLVNGRPLEGGVSATTTLIEAKSAGGQSLRLVLRQYDPPAADAKPATAASDYRLLAALHAAGLRVPRPRLADDSGTILPAPCLLTQWIDGTPVTRPPAPDGFSRELATALAELHNTSAPLAEVPFLPDIRQVAANKLGTTPQRQDESVSEAAIRAALAGSWPPRLANPSRLLHGDYWPGNTLWRDGKLVAVVDWEHAAVGDPLADLGNIRLELAMAFGTGIVDDFTAEYRALMPDLDVSALPLWDLYAALRPAGQMTGWGLPSADLDQFLAGHRDFTRAALRQV